MPDLQHVYNVLVGAIMALGLWFVQRLVTKTDNNTADIAQFKTDVARAYQTKEEATDDRQYIRMQLEKILDKIERKADK